MNLLEKLIRKTQGMDKTIILPEGRDPRIRQAAAQIAARNIARVIVLARPEDRQQAENDQLADNSGVEYYQYLDSPHRETLAAELHRRRQAKGWTMEQCREKIQNPLYFAGMMVHQGMADGLVAGSLAATSELLRAAFHCVGTANNLKTGSSCFVFDLPHPSPGGDDVLLYADCAVNPNPDAEALVDIALATAQSHRSLIGGKQRLAFLSFSSKGSAKHEMAEKMARASDLARRRAAELGIRMDIDGELQADAALVPEVAAEKCPGSPLEGRANILIFPDLQAANICYKITERLAGATAYGPILQGLARPINDLSRGCSVEDIVGVAAITVCQAGK